MPAADPPHRAPPGATADQRAEMLDLAVAGEPGLAVDRRELRRDGRSYSIDTLLELRTELGGDAPVALLVGADSFVGLPDWHRWREERKSVGSGKGVYVRVELGGRRIIKKKHIH